ncbi:hypothetical protein [Kineosporia sp. A_224]|uniref:hypothetical protein n=1 Tax=Kineosporia sp. A_224 TaxID=1962180 RepID=UPI001E30B976|nr:hypothetical protein [Kineosporia sp. A_224]
MGTEHTHDKGINRPAVRIAIAAAVVVAAILATWQISVGQRRPATFWPALAYTTDSAATGMMIYSDLAEIVPGTKKPGKLLPADVVIRGQVVSIEPGIGFASDGDSLESPVVPFDSDKAVTRWGRLVVKVQKVISGTLPAGTTTVKISWEVPRGTSIEDVNAAASTAGSGIFFLSPAVERLKRTGKPVADSSYYSSVYLLVGSAAFIQTPSEPGIVSPVLADSDRETLLKGAVTVDEVERRIVSLG